MEKQNIDIIISINVYKNVQFLKDQLDNIKKYVKSSFIVILNCNDLMFDLLKNESLPNTIINPEVINKWRGNGILTKGIVSNMSLANEKFIFKYFIILSGRTIFYKELSFKNLDYIKRTIVRNDNFLINKFFYSKLGKYYQNLKKSLYFSPHEGLCFNYQTFNTILNFLNSNLEIKEDIFTFNIPMEEYALQTIAVNEGTGFIYVGNGIHEDYSLENPVKFTRKIFFEAKDNKRIVTNSLLLRLNYKNRR